eukprot:CAMPEP_0198299576 /NCGR_PEP_ID=MMETSP1449-20131203/45309_1 /TAXON_ID=420275 /ORGANISM="Attheya septentrionalis, Strain CCMP2084" /LENGTH=160 /DNA_ID=CAMNT_0044001179 /DNA_START=160 /DNA_END=638 /DNA_ORIENTATION=+
MSGNDELRRMAMFVVFFISSMLVHSVDCFTTTNFPITTRQFGSNTYTHAFHTNQRTIVRMVQPNKEDPNDDDDEEIEETRSEERVLVTQKDETKNGGDNEKKESLDDWLDRPFFDPTSDQNTGLGKWFGDLVQQDYATAEALYVGLLFAIWLWVGQEWLR